MKESYLYLVETRDTDPPAIKVGISDNPTTRLISIQTGCPVDCYLTMCWRFPSRNQASAMEARFHKENASRRLNGEWFAVHIYDAIPAINEMVGFSGAFMSPTDELDFLSVRRPEHPKDAGMAEILAEKWSAYHAWLDGITGT